MNQIPIDFIKVDVSTEEFNSIGMDIAVIMVSSNLANTKSEARRHIMAGSVRLNDQVVRDPFARLVMKDNQMVVVEREKPTDFFQ